MIKELYFVHQNTVKGLIMKANLKKCDARDCANVFDISSKPTKKFCSNACKNRVFRKKKKKEQIKKVKPLMSILETLEVRISKMEKKVSKLKKKMDG